MSGPVNAKIIIDNGGIKAEADALAGFSDQAQRSLMELYDVGGVPWSDISPICDLACEIADQVADLRERLRYAIRDLSKQYADSKTHTGPKPVQTATT